MNNQILELVNYMQLLGNEFKKSSTCSNSNCNLRDLKILDFLYYKKKSMSEIADHMDLTKGSMTTAIDSLIEKKYVQREHDSKDRRKIFISLTDSGKLIANQIYNQHLKISTFMLSSLSNSEKKSFLNILNKITKNLK